MTWKIYVSAVLVLLGILFAPSKPSFAEIKLESFARDVVQTLGAATSERGERIFDRRMVFKELGGDEKKRPSLQALIDELNQGMPDYQIMLSRVLSYKAFVVIEGVLRGTHTGKFRGISPTRRNVSTSVVLFSRVVDGKVKDLLAYFGFDVLLQQMTEKPADAFPMPKKPESVEVGEGIAVKMNQGLHSRLYAFAGYALAGRIAGMQGRSDIAKSMVLEIELNTMRNTVNKVKPYTKAMANLKMRIGHLFASGHYIVTLMKASAIHSGDLGGVKPTKKPVHLELLTVAHVSGNDVDRAQVYFDSSKVLNQLR